MLSSELNDITIVSVDSGIIKDIIDLAQRYMKTLTRATHATGHKIPENENDTARKQDITDSVRKQDIVNEHEIRRRELKKSVYVERDENLNVREGNDVDQSQTQSAADVTKSSACLGNLRFHDITTLQISEINAGF